MRIVEPEIKRDAYVPVSRRKKVATVVALAAVLALPVVAYWMVELFG